jgi:hypothetical protein
MALVHDYYIFDEQEMEKIGLVCPECNTESVFDYRHILYGF